MNKIIFILILAILASFSVYPKPKYQIEYGFTAEKFAKTRIINETNSVLICYIAIDGYKRFFKLNPYQSSDWFKATDLRFTYRNFSHWCDFSTNHPNL
jgi:hypothetical protein